MTVSEFQVAALLDGSTPLPIIDAEVTLDESWSPYCQARLTLPLAEGVPLPDPRQQHRVTITARQDFGSSARVSAVSELFQGPSSTDVPTRTNLHREPVPTAGTRWPALAGWSAGVSAGIATYTATGTSAAAELGGSGTTAGSTHAELVAGVTYSMSAEVRASVPVTLAANANWRTAAAANINSTPGAGVAVPANTWTPLTITAQAPANTGMGGLRVRTPAGLPAGTVIEVRNSLIEAASVVGTYFDGTTPKDDARQYRWSGTAFASTSISEARVYTVADASDLWSGLYLFEVSARYYEPYNPFGVRSPQRRRFNLMLRDRIINRADGTVTLMLASDEAMLIDRRWIELEPFQSGSTDARTITQRVLARIGAPLQPGSDTGVVDADATEQLPGTSDWDYLQSILQPSNLRLWCDENREWRLESFDVEQPGSWRIDSSRAIDDTDAIARSDEDIFDAVVIRYRWTDSLGVQQEAYDAAEGENWSKARELVYENTRYPGPGAAQNILRRARGRGRTREIRAVADLQVTPGQPAQITINDDTQSGYVRSVRLAFPADEMTVATRGLLEIPPTAWLFDEAGITWNDIPVGVDWTEDI